MTRIRSIIWALVCALLFAVPLAAAPAAPAAPAGKSAPAKSRRATSTGKAGAKAAAKPAPPAEAASRRLEDVRIEGELEVPRVTFITVRKPHRFNDFARPANVRSGSRMAAETTLPAWIPPPSPPQEARKENR
jgi:hypothetical protein